MSRGSGTGGRDERRRRRQVRVERGGQRVSGVDQRREQKIISSESEIKQELDEQEQNRPGEPRRQGQGE
jgi:hypothetical protein